MKKLVLLMVVLAVAGCSKKPAPDPNIALCPEKTVKVMQDNQAFFSKVVPGETRISGMKKMQGLVRKATLEKPGEESVGVLFYQTSLPRCPWMVWGESLTPVMVRDGVIVSLGSTTLKDMTAHGWVLKEATWPWQRYDFGYLPQK